MRFKQEHPFEKRVEIVKRIQERYPDRIPVIVEKVSSRSSNIPDISKKKYLVPSEITVGQLVYQIRGQMQLDPRQALFLFVGDGALPPTGSLMSQIYQRYKDDDGLLYIQYAGENTFG